MKTKPIFIEMIQDTRETEVEIKRVFLPVIYGICYAITTPINGNNSIFSEIILN